MINPAVLFMVTRFLSVFSPLCLDKSATLKCCICQRFDFSSFFLFCGNERWVEPLCDMKPARTEHDNGFGFNDTKVNRMEMAVTED